MDLNLTGRVTLVTGGSKGIGLACAIALAQEGARVAIASRDRANIDAALARLPALSAQRRISAMRTRRCAPSTRSKPSSAPSTR